MSWKRQALLGLALLPAADALAARRPGPPTKPADPLAIFASDRGTWTLQP